MPVNVRPADLDQLLLMPPSVRDWLPDGHLAFFIADVVAELDLREFYGDYRTDGRGGAVYDPAMMLAVLLYAYCTGQRSSRRIERRLVEDVAYRVLAANQNPDHATLARFRRRHQDAIAAVFGQVLALCVQAGLVDAGLIAIDGTKLSADASFFANCTREQLAVEILAQAEATDAAEDESLGERRGDELPEAWAGGRDRRSRIRAALAELETRSGADSGSTTAEGAGAEASSDRKRRGRKPSAVPAHRVAPQRANTTDPHSRVVRNSSGGVLQGYNAQAAATAGQIVVAAEVKATSNDQQHFVPMATAASANLTAAGHGDPVGVFLADAGYWSAAAGGTDVGARVLIATGRPAWRRKARPDADKLAVLARVNRGELSMRQAAAVLGVSPSWISEMTKRYRGREGQLLTDNEDPGIEEWLPVIERMDRREITRQQAREQLKVSNTRLYSMLAHYRGQGIDPTTARQAMEVELADPANAALYRKRKHSIEPVFGNIKANLGYRRFTRRGLAAVNSEWRLICTAHNILKLRQAQPA